MSFVPDFELVDSQIPDVERREEPELEVNLAMADMIR